MKWNPDLKGTMSQQQWTTQSSTVKGAMNQQWRTNPNLKTQKGQWSYYKGQIQTKSKWTMTQPWWPNTHQKTNRTMKNAISFERGPQSERGPGSARARVKGSKLKLCTRARGPRTPFTPRTSFKGNCVEINNDGKTELLMKHTFVPSSSLPRGHDHSCHSRWSIPASSAMDEHLLLCWGDESDHRVAPGLGGSRLQISNLPPWYPGFLHIILPSRVSQYDVYLP